jgi:predicted dehydrogenase
MSADIRWGICGTGRIAHKFAADLRLVPGAALTAVASRDRDAADAFAARFGVARAHGSYADLAADDTVDVVYVATPQSRHHADARMFLAAGKAVLCEKPFTMNHAEAVDLVDTARRTGLFLMEAMWTRYLPVHRELRALLADGAIGDVHLVTADFGYRLEPGTPHRLHDPALGGGSLLDIGVYPVSLASQVLGPPDRVAALREPDPETGVDTWTGAVLGHPGGALAVVGSSIRVATPGRAEICGTAGRVTVERPFHAATALTVTTDAGQRRVERPFPGVGLHFQVVEVNECLRSGRLESAVMPWAESVTVMETLDRVRAAAVSAGERSPAAATRR